MRFAGDLTPPHHCLRMWFEACGIIFQIFRVFFFGVHVKDMYPVYLYFFGEETQGAER